MKSFKTLPVAAATFVMMSLAALTPGNASTETAVTVSGLNLRAGPGTAYPVISVLPANAAVDVIGCTAGTSWCDVSFGPTRGWVYSKYLQISFNDQLVVITPAVRSSIGINVVHYNNDHGHSGGQQGQGFFKAFRVTGKNGKAVVGVTKKGIASVSVQESARGNRKKVTIGACANGTCKGVTVKKTRRGKLDVTPFSIGRGSEKSRKAVN